MSQRDRKNPSSPPGQTARLEAVIRQCVPEIFRAATYDWLSFIRDDDLSGFFEDLFYSKEYLDTAAEHYVNLSQRHRDKQLILHIDDDPALHTLIQLMITLGLGDQVKVISVAGSAGGLILSSVLLPDLVLTDIMEPGMDGFRFAEYLKKNPVTRHVPLVFLTAKGDPDSVRLGMELGAEEYMSKPILQRDLIAHIQTLLGLEGQPPVPSSGGTL